MDISVPSRVTKKFPKTLWCYYVREIKAPAYKASLTSAVAGSQPLRFTAAAPVLGQAVHQFLPGSGGMPRPARSQFGPAVQQTVSIHKYSHQCHACTVTGGGGLENRNFRLLCDAVAQLSFSQPQRGYGSKPKVAA